ncbi:MAG: hypothetical protein A3F11_07900 [Gammaproteobacteria bacterium RIFCSPHIGHO2_12_FULL_37_14]|nr:MAG: hypothetical protein A3F11_07900 [Gammaproteobacteria bacterium RIFCSPHIGHO2_12_FULL_37_14]
MKNPKIKKINGYLKTDHQGLKSLYERIKKIELLTQKIFTYLDPNLKKYCQIVNDENNRLIMLVENAAIATQLRFQTANLITQFKHDPTLKHIQDIHYKVRPLNSSYSKRYLIEINQPPLLLSRETAETIKNTAQTIEDLTLRNIMEKIAQHYKK